MKTYVGLKEKTKPVIFESETEPGKETHPQYEIIHGPYKSKADEHVSAMDVELSAAKANQQRVTGEINEPR